MSCKQHWLVVASGFLALIVFLEMMAHVAVIMEAEVRKPINAVIAQPSHIITIDRSKPFNPVQFTNFGEDWNVIEEQDERSLVINVLDLNKVHLVDCLKDGEDRIKGEERLKRLKKMGSIQLDAKILQTLFEKQELIPESWRQLYICFDGTVIRDPKGGRVILYMYWEDDRWNWQCNWLRANNYCLESPSAVLRD